MSSTRNSIIQEITDKYLEKGKELAERIRECERLHLELDSMRNGKNQRFESLADVHVQREKSQARNEEILQDLQKTKAILRTQSVYSPNEQELHDLATIYRKCLEDENKCI